MEKAGLKTFVYSFVFSLFAIFGTNSVYLRTLTPKTPEIKISNKNITLFLRREALAAADAAPAPAKKIVLSVLPEISETVSSDTDAAGDEIPLMADNKTVTEESGTPVLTATNTIPLQLPEGFDASNASEPSRNLKQSEERHEKIAVNFEKIIKSPPPVDETELRSVPAQTAVSTPAKTETAALSEEKNQTVSEPEKPVELAALEYRRQNASTQKAAPQPAARTALLIPLEKNRGIIRTGKKEIEIAEKAPSNQIALNAANVPIKSMIESDKSQTTKKEDPNPRDNWTSMAEKKAKDNPWAVAKGAGHPKNSMVLESESYKSDNDEIKKALAGNNRDTDKTGNVELASATVKNLLIPIPEDILNDENLTPQLVSSPKEKSSEEELAAKEAQQEEDRQRRLEEKTAEDIPSPGEGKKSLLSSISSIFSGNKGNMPLIGDQVESDDDRKDSLFTAFRRRNMKTPSKQILPTEIRLSFQPNRAEISGQTLKWIRAFANKTVEEPSTGLEIRIDGTSAPYLQQRRLNLLQNILGGEGVDYAKVNTVFTSREPNSFIIRTIRINNATKDGNRNTNSRRNNPYKQW